MTRFRPCIDLRQGQVVQIVGASLGSQEVRVNHVASEDAADFARRYAADQALGGHVIQLGAGNEAAARRALAAWPGGLQLGGGVNDGNARDWLDAGASKLIVTSWCFIASHLSRERVAQLSRLVGPERLVLDLSCRRQEQGWRIATNRWQTISEEWLTAELLQELSAYCSEFLVHAADVEGLCQGIDEELVQFLGQASPIPLTYAGGARCLADLDRVSGLSQGRIDLTIGSALDIFGGSGARYDECIAWNQAHASA